MKKQLFLVGLILSVFLISFVIGGPYGEGDSADLTYEIECGGITFKYGDTVKYETVLNSGGDVNEELCDEVSDEDRIPEIEQDVLNALNSSEWVPATVKVHEINSELVNSVLNSLAEDEFQFDSKVLRGDGFRGNISQKGLDKLMNNSDVRLIYLNRVSHILENETSEDQIDEDLGEEIKIGDEKNLLWLWVTIGAILIIILYFIINGITRKH